MKNLNRILILCLSVLMFATTAQAKKQKKKAVSEDLGRIVLNTYIPNGLDVPASAKNILESRLTQMTTKNGVGGSVVSPRFVIVPSVNILTKDITPTAPPQVALTLEVTLYVGDGIDGTVFSSTSMEVKGVGTNESKAYTAALKNIKPMDPNAVAMIEEGKKKIIDHFNKQCEFIIKDVDALVAQKQFDAAIMKLMSVPEVCKECHEKCLEKVEPIYQQHIDRQCEAILEEAKNIWAAGQNMENAEKAAKLLATIDPDAKCFEDIKKLNKDIAKKVAEIDDREWKYTLEDQDQEKDRIDAYKKVGVAYGNNQPETAVYTEKVDGWVEKP